MELKPASFVLASLLTAYPTPDLEESVNVLMSDPEIKMDNDLRKLILNRVKAKNLLDMQSEYIDIFDRGQTTNPAYETEYGRHRALAKGNELSDIAGFYKAFGFELDEDRENRDMIDHVSTELEFYALLLMKQVHLDEIKDSEGSFVVEDGRKKFLMSHLAGFIGAVCNRPGIQESEYYRCIYGWVADLVGSECLDLKIQVEQVDWIQTEYKKDDEIKCQVDTGGLAKICN